MPDRENLQRLAKLVEINKKRLEEVEFQIERLNNVIGEHTSATESISALSSSKGGHIPIGAGVMIPLNSNKSSISLIDIGCGVFAEKTHDEAIEIMEKRTTELTNLSTRLYKEHESLLNTITQYTTEFNNATQTINSEPPQIETNLPPSSNPKPSRRRFGNELTLDD